MSPRQEKFYSPLFGSLGYLRQSRYLGFGLITVAPLLIVYELLAWQAQAGHHAILRNKADVIIKYPVHEFGPAGWVVLAVPVALCLLYIWRNERGRVIITVPFFFYPIIEGAMYASVMGLVIHRIITGMILSAPSLADATNPIMLAMGAGVYEELLFRGLLFMLPVQLFLRRWQEHPIYVYLLMAVTSSFLFTIFHYDSFFIRWDYTAVFRLIAGFLYCLLCITRGLSVAAYSHFLYDLFLII